jgi:hypothetical protein
MKKQLIIYLLIFSSLALHGNERIAVSSFLIRGHDSPELVEEIIIDSFITNLSAVSHLKIIERRKLDLVLREQEVALSGLVDSNTIIETGKIIGSTAIITGNCIFLDDEKFFSARCIDNTSGEVLYAVSGNISGNLISGLNRKISDMVAALASGVLSAGGGGEKTNGSSLWYTSSQQPEREKPILIYAMSDVADSVDAYGQWYLGPSQIKPVTDALRLHGFGVEVHDRRTLKDLLEADLSKYGQVWLLEGDSNLTVDPGPKEVQALYNYFLNGGSVWLCGENIPDPESNCWVEDINAFARPFGLEIAGTAVTVGYLQHPDPSSHPLFSAVDDLVFDFEIGFITYTNPDVRTVMTIEPEARILREGWNLEMLFRYSDPQRYKQIVDGKKPEWTFGWLLKDKFNVVGPELGPGAAGIVVIDGRNKNQGRLIADAGWVLGWAFTTDERESYQNADNIRFTVNAAEWLAD